MEKEGNKDSSINKGENNKNDFIKWFSELNKGSGNVAGGKGANLAEIYNLKISVPPGFVVTAQAYDFFIKKAGLAEKIKNLLGKINYEDTEQLNKVTGEIRTMIEKSSFSKEMEEEILEAYDVLGSEESYVKDKSANYLVKKSPEPPFVAVRSSATTEDLADASFAGQQETFLNVKGNESLLISIKKCFSSLFTPRATYYRQKKGFVHEKSSLAVIVQKMINSDKSGVIFSKDPSMKNENIIIEAVFGLGEGIVSGEITPDRYIVKQKSSNGSEFEILEKKIGSKKIAITRGSDGKKAVVKLKEEKSKQQALTDYEIKKLAEISIELETHYAKPQDIEFAVENNEIYIVQTRPITTLEKRFEAGSHAEALKGEIVLSGLAASPGIGSGKVKIVLDLKDLGKVNQGDVLVTRMTNPDMVVTMQKSAAIVTDEGGLTAHAAIVSREMGIPAIVGTEEATTKLKEGEIITVDGFTGKVYKGKVAETIVKEIKPVTSKTKTEIKVIIDLPSAAKRAAQTKLSGVGLARLEGVIAESGKHPLYFMENKNLNEYEEIIFKGVSEIANYFDEIWVRTSDIRSDEFSNLKGAPKEKEANPMLGMHGIRYSLKYPEILKAELNAMRRVSEKQGRKIGIMAPQIIFLEEVKKLKEMAKEIGFKDKIGIMIETPASVQMIEEFCNEGIDFVSFGTNDLTQYTLAVDRGNREVQGLYNDLHTSVLRQLEHVIKVCKEKNIETSICGQAGSKKEMVKFLVNQGITSISVNADVASEIASYVAELESGAKESEDKEKTKTGEIKQETEAQEEKSYGEFVKPQSAVLEAEKEIPTQEQIKSVEPPTIKGAEYIEKSEPEKEEESIGGNSDKNKGENNNLNEGDEGKKQENKKYKSHEKPLDESILEKELGIVDEVKENIERGIDEIEKIEEEVLDIF